MINTGSRRPPLAPTRPPAHPPPLGASKPDPVERKLDAMAGADAEAALALETGISTSDCEEEPTTSCHAHTSNRSVLDWCRIDIRDIRVRNPSSSA